MILCILGICICCIILYIICEWLSDKKGKDSIVYEPHGLVTHPYKDKKGFRVVPTENAEIYLIDNFLSGKECDDIIGISDFSPSTTVSDNSDKVVDIIHPNRTSWTCFFQNKMHLPEYTIIDNKIKGLLQYEKYSEPMQIQSYKEGQHYLYHYDYFQPNSEHVTRGSGQRTYTCMVYLTDVQEGGETDFEILGIKIKPKRGMAVVWNNLYNNGQPNTNMRHAGLPPKKVKNKYNKKIILTKWFRQRRT